MENDLIPVESLCAGHHIESTFIILLQEYGLADLVTVESKHYIYVSQLNDIEKMIRFHYELDINIEGIQAIAHLLHRVSALQQELNLVKNRLQAYEQKDINQQ